MSLGGAKPCPSMELSRRGRFFNSNSKKILLFKNK
jgi:hypothetical protein